MNISKITINEDVKAIISEFNIRNTSIEELRNDIEDLIAHYYEEGFQDGYVKGESETNENNYNDGKIDGYDEGWQDGYNNAMEENENIDEVEENTEGED